MTDLAAARRARRRGLVEPRTPPLPVHEPGPELGPPLPAAAAAPMVVDERTPGWRPWPEGAEQRWRLYYIWGRLPAGAVWWLRLFDRVATRLFGPMRYLLYIGISGQYVPMCRPLNHVIRKSWAPDIEMVEFDDRTFPTEVKAEAAEAVAIRRMRPLHNIAHNVGNPCAADSALRRLPRHQRVARRGALGGLVVVLGATAVLWWALLTLARDVEPLGNALSSGVGAFAALLWALMVASVGKAALR
jgi:hypothetical protein